MKVEKISGEGAIIASCFFFAVGAVLIKVISGIVDIFLVSFCNFSTGIILGLSILRFSRERIRVKDSHYLLFRGMFGAIAMICYFVAIHLTTSGRATLLNTTFPIFSAIFGFLLFQETITRNSVIGLMLCIGGAFFVFFDKSGGTILGNIIGLLSGIAGGMAAHYVKKARERNHSVVVYLSACVIGLLVTVFSVPQIVAINGRTCLMLLATGILAFVAQVLMTYGFKHTTATRASIMTFFKIPLTLFLTVLILQETMASRFIIGTILIVAGLVLNSWKRAEKPETVII